MIQLLDDCPPTVVHCINVTGFLKRSSFGLEKLTSE
jgi:hypothetical protein